jgi:Uma2 family endonuclease
MPQAEIIVPITDPETEWIRGRALQKVSPTFDHARVQTKLVVALDPWAKGKGTIGTEWRFRFAPPGEAVRPLVPDIAFVDARLLATLEVLSPGDRADDVADKVQTYLRAGSALVIVADPCSRTFSLHDSSQTRVVTAGDTLEHPALPGFTLDVRDLFAAALDE